MTCLTLEVPPQATPSLRRSLGTSAISNFTSSGCAALLRTQRRERERGSNKTRACLYPLLDSYQSASTSGSSTAISYRAPSEEGAQHYCAHTQSRVVGGTTE